MGKSSEAKQKLHRNVGYIFNYLIKNTVSHSKPNLNNSFITVKIF